MMVVTCTDLVIFPAKKLDRGRMHKIHEIHLEIGHSKQNYANVSEKYQTFHYKLLQVVCTVVPI